MHKIMCWTVLSVFVLCIISTVALAVNQTGSPSGVNNNNVTDEPILSSTSTESDFFATSTQGLLTETTLLNMTTDSTPTESSPTNASTTETTTLQTTTETVPKGIWGGTQVPDPSCYHAEIYSSTEAC